MGRLSFKLPHRAPRLAKNWAIPVIIALAAVFGLNQALAATPPTTDELTEYLQSNQLQVGSESIDGRQQIYYEYSGNRIFITSSSNNHIHPVAAGRFITWEEVIKGESQVIVYDVLNQTSLSLSTFSNNQNPVVDSQGQVVWERWIDEKWQIIYYDGALTTKQLSFDSTAIRPDIRGTEVVFAQYSAADDLWHNIKYDLVTDQTTDLGGSNGTAAWPHFNEDGSVSGEPTSYR